MTRLVMIPVLLFGILLLYFSQKFFFESWDLTKNAEHTYGEVVDYTTSQSDGTTYYYPVLTFTTRDGQTITFDAKSGSSKPKYAYGEKVELLYDAANPSNAREKGFFALWGGALIAGVMGLIQTGIALFFLDNPFASKDDDDDDEEDDDYDES